MSSQFAFQAVVLAAGMGSRMPEVTAGKPKCLLPVGNKPVVWYVFQKLQQINIKEAIMVVADTQRAEIQGTLEKTNLTIKIEYVSVTNEIYGTADSLRFISDKLTSNVIVLPCDLITDVNLMKVFNVYFKHPNTSACAFFFKQSVNKSTVVPGPKSKQKPDREIIGITNEDRLVLMTSTGDYESSDLNRLSRYGRTRVYTTLIDSHVYILKNWIIKYLAKKPNISSIKGELLPHIIKKQAYRSKEASDILSDDAAKEKVDILEFAAETSLDKMIMKSSSRIDHYGDSKPAYLGDTIRCFAYIADDETYGVRVNNLASFYSINSRILELWDSVTNHLPLVIKSPTADISSTQVDKCILCEKIKLCEKSSYKSSIIGANSTVEKFSRIFNSILMNNVTVNENVLLENCIVCNGATIESGCKLKNCIVENHYKVPEKSVHTNEILMKDQDF